MLLISITTTVQPVSPADGDAYFVPTGATGVGWSLHPETIAYFSTLFGDWLYSGVSPDVVYIVEDQPFASGNAPMIYRGAGSFSFLLNASDSGATDRVVYVSTVSERASDAHAGSSPDFPKSSIQSAITASVGGGPSQGNPGHVIVLDGSVYTEDLVIDDYVQVWAPHATIQAASVGVTLGTESALHVYRLEALVLDRTAGSSAFALLDAAEEFGPVINTVAGSTLIFNAGYVEVAGGAAIGGTTTDGEIILDVGKIGLFGNSTVGISCANAAGTFRGRVGRILDMGFTTTTGIVVSNGTASLTVDSMTADTVYNVSGGTLNLHHGALTGAQTHSGGTLRKGLLVSGNAAVNRSLLVHDGTDWTNNDAMAGNARMLTTTAAGVIAGLAIATNRIVGRLTGEIVDLTGAQVGGLIALGDLSNVGTATPTLGHAIVGDGTNFQSEATSGTSFPGSPREGLKIYRTDLEEWFYFDSSRSKWLSERTHVITGFNASNTVGPSYIFADGTVPYAAAIGWVCPWDCIAAEMSILVGSSSTCTFNVQDDGSDVTGGSLALSAQTKNSSAALNSSTIASGSVVSLRVSTGTATGGCLVYVTFRRVAT